MKLWRDFKLLALCAGLLAIDGCKPPPEEDPWASVPGGAMGGRLLGRETCGDVTYLVVAVVELGVLATQAQPKLVAGEYRGQAYPQLVRFRTGDFNGSDTPQIQVGTCVNAGAIFLRLYPPCFTDQIATYVSSLLLSAPESGCAGVASPR
jgi:hypothetical protein